MSEFIATLSPADIKTIQFLCVTILPVLIVSAIMIAADIIRIIRFNRRYGRKL